MFVPEVGFGFGLSRGKVKARVRTRLGMNFQVFLGPELRVGLELWLGLGDRRGNRKCVATQRQALAAKVAALLEWFESGSRLLLPWAA